jgi:predicted Zn-dependent protease
MKRFFFKALLLVAVLSGCATTTQPGVVGVNREQLFLIDAPTFARLSFNHYAAEMKAASNAGRLINAGPEYDRLIAVAKRIIRQTPTFRNDVRNWRWEVNLVENPERNATCADGGKIVFYTGIIRSLRLTDDEIAAIMGHEVAHALREHSREQYSRAYGTSALINAASAASKRPEENLKLANHYARYIIELPNSREAETEADKIGLELMARAGFDPRAAVNVWRKMASIEGNRSSSEFSSTHPAHSTRIRELSSLLQVVWPLYEKAAKY